MTIDTTIDVRTLEVRLDDILVCWSVPPAPRADDCEYLQDMIEMHIEPTIAAALALTVTAQNGIPAVTGVYRSRRFSFGVEPCYGFWVFWAEGAHVHLMSTTDDDMQSGLLLAIETTIRRPGREPRPV